MVQAILDGRKSMTRRVCKDIPDYDFHWGLDREPYVGNYQVFTKTGPKKWDWVTLENQWLYDLQTAVDENKTYLLKCPYGQPGDRLWVRETWADLRGMGFDKPFAYLADSWNSKYGEEDGDSKRCRLDYGVKWKPSIHMFKIAARIWLEVVSVRVERLQEITRTDIRAEGLVCPQEYCSDEKEYNFRHWFLDEWKRLWDSINSKRGYCWNSNPWVWVVEFRKVSPCP